MQDSGLPSGMECMDECPEGCPVRLRLSLPELCPDERVTKPFWTTAGSSCCFPLLPFALASCCAEASTSSAHVKPSKDARGLF